jgi:hypothetical protein
MDYFAGLDISMDETHVCVLDREARRTCAYAPALRSLYRLALVRGIMIPHSGRGVALSSCQSAEATRTAASSSINL